MIGKEKNMVQVTGTETEVRAIVKKLASCGGTGARFPWLRLRCPRCFKGKILVDQYLTEEQPCPICDGRGWVPNYHIRLEDVLTELAQFGYEWHVHHEAGTYYAGLRGSDWATARGPDLKLVFWQAVEKAVSHAS